MNNDDSLPSLDSLRCFSAAAETLNFRAAARAVHLTPAALGQRIRQLEVQFNVRLFERSTRRVALTDAGLALKQAAVEALAATRRCAHAARGDSEPAPLGIVLGTRYELGMSWVLPQLDDLMRTRQNLTVHLYFGSSTDLMLRLRTREVDCVITSMRLTDPRLEAIRVHDESFVFAASPALLARIPFRCAADAVRHTLIDYSEDLPLFRYWRDSPKAPVLHFAKVLRIGTVDAIVQLVRRGHGVAVLPRFLVASLLGQGKLVELLPRVRPLSDAFRLVYRAHDPWLPIYQALATKMREMPLR